MSNRVLMFLFAGILGIALTPSSAFAKGPEVHGHDKGKHIDHDRDSGRPPGWSKGKKTGWRGGDEPPGLEKKEHHPHHSVRHNTHRTHHHPTTTKTATTVPTRRYPPATVTGKPAATATAPKTTASSTRRPADFDDRPIKK